MKRQKTSTSIVRDKWHQVLQMELKHDTELHKNLKSLVVQKGKEDGESEEQIKEKIKTLNTLLASLM